jgi:two-component system, chemotaxis family, chemotaxis protein CheY
MSYSILIVDDSAVIRAVVRRSIKMSGIEVGQVHEAENGLKALEVLVSQWIDIVFADLNMPGMGGVELVDKMAGDDLLLSIPVVIVTAEQNPQVIEQLKKRGIRAYLKKPFRPEGFRNVVLDVLGDPGARAS